MEKINTFAALLRKFQKDESGSFALPFSLGFLTTFYMAFGAMDISTLHSKQAKLQDITDAALLQLARDDVTAKTDAKIEEDFRKIFNQMLESEDQIIATKLPTVKVYDDGHQIRLVGNVTARSDTMVLHNIVPEKVRYSVNSVAVYGTDKIEVAVALDISSSMKGARITEAKKAAKNFVETLLATEDLQRKVSVSIVPYGGTVRLPGELKNMATIAVGNADTQHWTGGIWNQCLHINSTDVQSGIVPLTRLGVIPDFYSWNKGNPWCPKPGNEFIPLTNDKADLLTKIDAFSLSDGTGTDHGVAWARAMLSPDWRGKLTEGRKGTPLDRDENVRKIMIVMTDGGITGQHMVKDNKKKGSLPYYSQKKARYSNSQGYTNFASVCTDVKEEKTKIYTIGFLMKNKYQITQLKNCATNSDYHFDAKAGQLDSVFQAIATSVAPLRIQS